MKGIAQISHARWLLKHHFRSLVGSSHPGSESYLESPLGAALGSCRESLPWFSYWSSMGDREAAARSTGVWKDSRCMRWPFPEAALLWSVARYSAHQCWRPHSAADRQRGLGSNRSLRSLQLPGDAVWQRSQQLNKRFSNSEARGRPLPL